MKTIKCYFFLGMLTMLSFESKAQAKLCSSPHIDLISKNRIDSCIMNQREVRTVDKLVRVYFHICRNNDGTGAAATISQIESDFSNLISDYASANICFVILGTNYINNSDLNHNFDPEYDESELFPYIIPTCLNIFYHLNLINSGGNSFHIPNYFCSINSSNIGSSHTISHEVGHCFGLYHTFETAFGEEYIDGTDCIDRGDLICDTAADPFITPDISGDCFVAVGCLYIGYCEDPEGAINYSPPYNNIMAYWWSKGCPITGFTNLQLSRCQVALNVEPILLLIQSSASLTLGPFSSSSGYQLSSAINNITTIGIVSMTGEIEACLSSRLVKLNPGFNASPTTGIIQVRPTICNY